MPRTLFLVEDVTREQPLGVGVGRRALRAPRSRREKRPWRDVPTLESHVEAQFIRALLLGSSLLPFGLAPSEASVVPWDGQHLLSSGDPRLDDYLADRWRRAEELWEAQRRNPRLKPRRAARLPEKADPTGAPQRVVYGASGMYLAAARLRFDRRHRALPLLGDRRVSR